MEFKEAVRTCLSKYATFSGRASRSEYWWFYLFNGLVGVAAGLLDLLISRGNPDVQVIGGLVGLALLLPNIAVFSRRLHDTDRSGWWMMLVFAPFAALLGLGLGGLLGVTPGSGGFSALMIPLLLAAFAAFVVLFLWLIRRGTDGPNRFGPDPLG